MISGVVVHELLCRSVDSDDLVEGRGYWPGFWVSSSGCGVSGTGGGGGGHSRSLGDGFAISQEDGGGVERGTVIRYRSYMHLIGEGKRATSSTSSSRGPL